MSSESRARVEQEIDRVLLQRWDPLGVASDPANAHAYTPYVHDVFGLLARGASDVQIARHLHRIETQELQHPELADRDLGPLVKELRRVESEMLA
jgi:hypothetical protein